jgi:chemotaxis response regulator CheB
MTAPIRVLIADDSDEFRKSIHAILVFEEGLQVVAVARDGAEAV